MTSTNAKVIEVVPYNHQWPQMFEAEADIIKKKLSNCDFEIHHVGSTSVPGLKAKPIIDIIMVTKNPDECIVSLESAGYEYKGEVNIPFRFYFSKEEPISVHLHMYEPGSPEIDLNLKFRDFLRSHPEACSEYANLKDSLAEEQKKTKNTKPMFSHYTLGKNNFITSVLEQAKFDKLRLMHCTHYAEWEAAKTFRKQFFSSIPTPDPYTWTFNHPDHIHFVLYKGTKIIGYSHLQRWCDQRIALRMLLIDENLKELKFEDQFLTLCEKWLKAQGIKSMHLKASPSDYKFFCERGYFEMPFNSPVDDITNISATADEDVALGKML